MKLSEMNTRQMAAALCALTQPMARIAKDEEIDKAMRSIAGKSEQMHSMTAFEKGATLMEELVPLMLGKHYDDAVEIISALTGKTAKEIDEQNGMQTVNDLLGSLDGKFFDFFRSSAVMGKTATDKQE